MAMAIAAAESGFGEVRTAEVNGVSLAYEETGAGEPVVFVHGGISDLRTWREQLPAIGASHRAIAYSRRYARPNADIAPGADDQLETHVDDLAALLRAIDAAPAHLVGNSWGAFVCLLVAIRHPELVRTLTLEEPPLVSLVVGAGTRPQPRVLLSSLARRPRTTLAVMRFGAGTVARVQKAFRSGDDEHALLIFACSVLGEEAYERLPAARKQQMRENVSALKAQMLGAGFPPLAPADLRRVQAPALLLTGEHSPAFLVRLSDALGRLLPQAEHAIVPGASHAMHEENPAAVNAALLGFLERHAGGRA